MSEYREFKVAVTIIEMVLAAKERIDLPSRPGSMWRGALGYSLRAISCAARRADCQGCLLRATCAYAYIFETPPPADAAIMRLYPTVPHPFVLQPPAGGPDVVAPGETLALRLVVIGRSRDYLPHYVLAVQEMGRRGLGPGRGRAELVSVRQLNWPDDSSVELFSDRTGRLADPAAPATWTDIVRSARMIGGGSELSLELVTPLRVKFRDRFIRDLDFHHLIRNLLRRLSALSYFHCGGDGVLDFRDLIGKAELVRTLERRLGWLEWERYSGRQHSYMNLGGLVGQVTFSGDLDEFRPYLLLGQLVHAGKGTSFGLGQYRMVQGEFN